MTDLEYEQFLKDKANSTFDLQRIVIPKIKDLKIFKQNQSVVFEDYHGERLAIMFDQESGIDLMIDKILIASRIQWIVPKNEQFITPERMTITQRYKRVSGAETEDAKRIDELATGKVGPHLTMHAYISSTQREGELLSF